MQNENRFKEHLMLFKGKRKEAKFPSPNNRKNYADVIAECFIPCAKYILAGHFKVTKGDSIRNIYPTAIELYYHEEGSGRFKDPIMYHTNDRKLSEHEDYFSKRGIPELPYFPFGSFNPHTSGIDVTFENQNEHYRASFLIREYDVEYLNREGAGKKLHVKNSTDIYDDMLLAGIPIVETDWIEWCDGERALNEEEIVRKWRKNVADYRPKKGELGKWEKNPEGDKLFSSSEGRFAKCPFEWQFAKKKK